MLKTITFQELVIHLKFAIRRQKNMGEQNSGRRWCSRLGCFPWKEMTHHRLSDNSIRLGKKWEFIVVFKIDPLGQPKVTAGRDHCFLICCPYVRTSVDPSPLFRSRKTKQQKTMFATDVTLGLAEWIIDDTCLPFFLLQDFFRLHRQNKPYIHHFLMKIFTFQIILSYCIKLHRM